jgi:hypothetical protein
MKTEKKISVKKTLGIICIFAGLAIGFIGVFSNSSNAAVIMGACFGTGLTLFGIKTAGGVAVTKSQNGG